jgi:transposase
MWTEGRRDDHRRDELRYASDLTDEEWLSIQSLIPPAKRGGNRRRVDIREVVNGLLYVFTISQRWRNIPHDLPARSTLYDYFSQWEYDGTLSRLYNALYEPVRDGSPHDAGFYRSLTGYSGVKGSGSAPGKPIRGMKVQRRSSGVKGDLL